RPRVGETRSEKPAQRSSSVNQSRGWHPCLFLTDTVTAIAPWQDTRDKFHALVSVNPHDILEQWASGITLNQIAESFQVSPSAITRWLQRNASPEDRELARELHYQT